jgi:uncharacterized membrane protein
MMAEIESGGSPRNGAGLRCYLAGILFPIIYLTTAPYKTNRFVRFHAFQSILFTIMWVPLTVVSNFLGHPSGRIGTLFSGIQIVFFVTWIILMFKAYHGEMFKLPLVGHLAARWASR